MYQDGNGSEGKQEDVQIMCRKDFCMNYQKHCPGWKENSVGKVLALQAQGLT